MRTGMRPGLNEPTLLELVRELEQNMLAGHRGKKQVQLDLVRAIREAMEGEETWI